MHYLTVFFLVAFALVGLSFAGNHNNGKAIYESSCKTCHSPSTAPLMKAASVHDVKAWKKRLSDAETIAKQNPEKYKNAMAVLVNSVKMGKGAMVPGGMCKNVSAPGKPCSDADYMAAIKFMMSPAQ